MKTRLISLSVITLFLSACDSGTNDTAVAPSESPGTANATEEDAIRAQVAKWLQLIKAKDAAAIAQMYAEDGAFMPPNASIGKGRAAIEKNWAGMMATPAFDLNFAPEQIIVSSSGDMALDRGTYRLTVAPDGKPQVDTGKYVVVWRKIDGEWKAAADIINSDLPAS